MSDSKLGANHTVTGKVKRILIVEANEDGTVGGSHQVMFDLVRNLDRNKYDPVVLFYQHNAYVDRLRDFAQVIVYDTVRREEIGTNLASGIIGKCRQLLRSVVTRVKLLRELRIDLVHINNSPRVGNDDWLPAARIVGIPCIANAAGDADGESVVWRRPLFRSFDHVMPVSDYMHSAMLGAGVPAGRLTPVHPGIDSAGVRRRVSRAREDVRRELDLAGDTILAVMVGNIRQWKGQHVVLEALQHMDRNVLRRLHVAFVGATGPDFADYEGQLRHMVAASDLESNVSFLGSRQDVPDFFAAADLALHASVIPEPFGLVIVEALACGAPVIAANAGGPAEIITEECGVIFDSARPPELTRILEDLVIDDARRALLSQIAPARAAVFSVDAYVAGIEAVYDHCCYVRPGRFRRVSPRPADVAGCRLNNPVVGAPDGLMSQVG